MIGLKSSFSAIGVVKATSLKLGSFVKKSIGVFRYILLPRSLPQPGNGLAPVFHFDFVDSAKRILKSPLIILAHIPIFQEPNLVIRGFLA